MNYQRLKKELDKARRIEQQFGFYPEHAESKSTNHKFINQWKTQIIFQFRKTRTFRMLADGYKHEIENMPF